MKHYIRKILALLLAVLLLGSVTLPAGAVSMTYRPTRAFTESRYYQELTAVELTGNYRTDLLNVALSQVGYHEGASEPDRNGYNLKSDKNWTEYGYYCECDGFAWCAMFVSWCARQAQLPKSLVSDSRVARAYAFNVPFEYKEDYRPAAGDIVFFAEPGEVWSHVGVVLKVTETGLYTVEGNSQDMVRVKFYKFDDEYIKGYGPYLSDPCDEAAVNIGNIYQFNFDLNGGEGKRRTQYTIGDHVLGLYWNRPDAVADDEEEIEQPKHSDWTWKDGCDFEGWYLRRDSDGKWLTVSGAWYSDEELITRRGQRKIFGDADGVTIDNSLNAKDGETFTCYAVWKDQETGEYVEDSAYIVEYDFTGWANRFKDLKETARYYDAAKDIISRGLMNGTADHIFSPDSALTRAQFLALLFRIDGSVAPEEATLPYTDVPEDSWFFDAVRWAYERGILEEGETLQPNAPLSRQEAARYLYRIALLQGSAEPVRDERITLEVFRHFLGYSDLNKMSPDCLEAVLWSYDQKMFLPVERDGRMYLMADEVLTRYQACELLSGWLS